MTMTAPVRNLMLTAHITASVSWLGALAVFLAHALASLVSQDDQIVRAASIAMGLTAWFVILPVSLLSLTTGLVQALGTAWGLFRHYWVVFKLLLTGLATVILLLKLAPISYLADMATAEAFSRTDLMELRTSIMIHAAGGLLVLLTVATLAVYKPRGMTRYGAQKQREQGGGSNMSTATPRWVKVFGLIVIGLVLMIVVMMLTGSHGPGAHAMLDPSASHRAVPALP